VAEVESFAHVHARVLAQSGSELVVADVDGPDFGQAPVEEDLGEASGGGTGVEGGQAGQIGRGEVEGLEGAVEVVGAAGDPRVGFGHGQLVGLGYLVGGLGHGAAVDVDPSGDDFAGCAGAGAQQVPVDECPVESAHKEPTCSSRSSSRAPRCSWRSAGSASSASA